MIRASGGECVHPLLGTLSACGINAANPRIETRGCQRRLRSLHTAPAPHLQRHGFPCTGSKGLHTGWLVCGVVFPRRGSSPSLHPHPLLPFFGFWRQSPESLCPQLPVTDLGSACVMHSLGHFKRLVFYGPRPVKSSQHLDNLTRFLPWPPPKAGNGSGKIRGLLLFPWMKLFCFCPAPSCTRSSIPKSTSIPKTPRQARSDRDRLGYAG